MLHLIYDFCIRYYHCPLASSSDDTKAIVIGVIIAVGLLIVTVAVGIAIYVIRQRHRKGEIHHVKFTDEMDDTSVLYSSEGPTISLDNSTDTKHPQLAS